MFRVWGAGSGVQALALWVWGCRFRVVGPLVLFLGLRFFGLGFRAFRALSFEWRLSGLFS